MKPNWQWLLWLGLVLAAASALCLFLYHWDNKYTRHGTQAIDGILAISAEEMKENDPHFLIHGWAFYPGILLTPEELGKSGNERYMTYTSIGENTGFYLNGSNRSHGCGTYVMNLLLPEERKEYGLLLPEIYSAYNLYVNGELVLEMGDPQQSTYTPRTQEKMIWFEAEGAVRLLLAVSDYSHFYSGMVYPPAFGSIRILNLIQGMRLGLNLCLATIGALVALLALYMSIYMKHKNSLLFSALCILFVIYSCGPLLHSVCALSIQPWYAAEIFISYAMILMVILLQNKLCEIERVPRYLSEIIWVLFSISALFYGLFSAELHVGAISLFSLFSGIFKLAGAIYLLIISFCAMKKGVLSSPILFSGSVFYAMMLVWDRILPAHEPIITKWFPEWGSIILIVAIGASLWNHIVNSYAYSVAFTEEHRQMKRQLSMQVEYAGQLKKRVDENRRFVHDLRHHMRAMREMALQIESTENTDTVRQELLRYMEEYPKSFLQKEKTADGFCNRIAIDVLLQYYHTTAKRQGIEAKLALYIPDNTVLSELEWCTVVGNLLENAIDACNRQTEGEKIIQIQTGQNPGLLFLKVDNSYDGKFSRQGERFYSRKTSGGRLGIGLESVWEIIHNHEGTMDIYPGEKFFSIGITLPVKKEAVAP